MNLYHLRYFVTLAHLEHYTNAADILSITQPSLSHAISSLEKELGVRLFEKEGRNIVLTKCGQAFLDDVEKSLQMLDDSINKLQKTANGEGRIDIAMLRILSTSVVPNFVRGFLEEDKKRHIDFQFHSSTGLTSDIIKGLKDRRYDIAFCSKIGQESSIEFTPVAKQELVLIVPENHVLAEKSEITLEETLGYSHIGFSNRSGLRTVIDHLYQECSSMPEYAYTLEEDQAVAGLVGAGFGIAVVPNMEIISHMPVKVIEILRCPWERVLYMAVLKGVYQTPALTAFKNYIEDHIVI